MIITCLGHAKFLLSLANGMKLVTDPFDASTGYPISPLKVDVTLVSHGHHDHSAIDTLTDPGRVIREPGSYTLESGVKVDAIHAFHDDVQGAKRGQTLLFAVEAEGLRVVHLGDLGHLLTDEQVTALGRVDVLMIPVGGFYTIGPDLARQVCEQLKPRVILPMHYRTRYNANWPIEPVDSFTGLFDGNAETVNLLRVTADDLKCQPKLCVLTPQC